jgi:hypothetical protein
MTTLTRLFDEVGDQDTRMKIKNFDKKAQLENLNVNKDFVCLLEK